MKTYYDLLGIAPGADAEEVKRAFRREIARYHPDKVQHLGPEFQEIASERAAALTEAYRTLMNEELRRRYDDTLDDPAAPLPPPSPSPAPPEAPKTAPAAAPDSPPAEEPRIDRRFAREQATTSEFVRRAVMARMNDAVGTLGGTHAPAAGFDAVYQIKGRKGLFRKGEPTVHLAVKIVSQVDRPSVEEAWGTAMRIQPAGQTVCVMLLGSGVAPARELATAVSDLRRKARNAAPVIIPVDVRDWNALLPPETPSAIRSLLEHLRQGN